MDRSRSPHAASLRVETTGFHVIQRLVLLEHDRPADAPAAISGRVQNVVTGQFLNNARITVRGTGLEVFTDQNGVYRLPQIGRASCRERVLRLV